MSYASLRAQEELDSKVASISGRLADMAGKEGRREVQRNELARQVRGVGVISVRRLRGTWEAGRT